jgi:AraC-like DNA-binding protein
MSKNPAIQAPLLNLPFSCEKAVVTNYRMPHFVRRNELAVHLLVHGEVRVIISNGQRLNYPVGRVAFSWGAIPHRAEFLGRNVTLYVLTLPLSWVLRWNLPERFMHAVLGGQTFFEPDLAKRPIDEAFMERWCDDYESPDLEVRRVMLMEVEARLRRLSLDVDLSSRSRRANRGGDMPVDKVERMIHHIAKHYAQPLGVAEIARAVELHPDYASRLFSQSTGTGLLDFLTQHRVAMAQSLLASTDAKIIDIALAAGFGSVSQFHAVFKRHLNCSPAGYRHTQRKGA